jgi:hypothetical protein
MAVIDTVAKEFHMKPGELLKESLKTYLEKKLSNVEAELFAIAKKYGVRDVFELDARIKRGLVGEKEAYDDYFALDNLEAERGKIKKFLEEL